MDARRFPSFFFVCLALGLAVLPAAAQSSADAARPLIALYEPSGQKADSTLTAALSTVADSVELDLACLQRFEVKRLAAVDPAKDMAKVRSYCQANRIDQAILGSGSAKPAGGYAFRLMLYDRRTDSVTLVQEGSSSGALDMFDTTDVLVAALLDKLSGTHLLFGSLTVQTVPEGAVVSLNGKEVGPSPLSLRGLPVGTVNITARSAGWEDGSSTATVQDNQVTDAALTLARSQGTLTLDMPRDATVKLRAAGIPERILQGPSSEQIPTGSYELEAACPGLGTVRRSLSVARNATASWKPWTGAYLEVSAEVEGAKVMVDGVPKGTVPLLLEVEPGVLHRVELSKDLYQPYQAELSVVAARKVSFAPELALKTGSIRVESTPAGVRVQIDDGRLMNTPCVFDNVPPGPHTVTAWDGTIARRWYKIRRSNPITVAAEQESVMTLQMTTGTATLILDDLPPSASVTVEGSPWQPGQPVTAGALAIVVTLPSGQTWSGTDSAFVGETKHVSVDTLPASIPVRKIRVDGAVGDWEGIEPLWGGVADKPGKFYFKNGIQLDPFPNQSGTNLVAAYVCRDDREIYVRMDFDDGDVKQSLTKDIRGNLNREIHFIVESGKSVNAGVNDTRQWGTGSWVGVWEDATRTWTQLANMLDAFAMKGSTLEFAIPLSRVRKLLSNGVIQAEVTVNDSGPNDWYNGYNSYRRPVDLSK